MDHIWIYQIMKVKINVGRTPTHTIKTAKCNGQTYTIPIPTSTFNFIEIVDELEISKNHEQTLAVISKQTTEVSSIEQFYLVQEDSLHYFNVKIQFNSQTFALTILSQPDLALQQLDKLKFGDLMSVLKNGYDILSIKLHSKLNRRLKKYLTESTRNETQKNQILQIINLMKETSSQDEAPQKPSQQKEKPTLRAAKNERFDSQNNATNNQNNVKKQYRERENKEQVVKPQKQEKQKGNEQHKPYKKHFGKKTESHHHHHKQKEDDQDEWQDVKQAKMNKRKQKNYFKKHLKNDLESHQIENQQESSEPNEDQTTDKKYVPKEKREERSENKRIFGNSREKTNKDTRVTLGITGDSDDGWRQRYRVIRQISNHSPYNPGTQKSSKKENVKYRQKPKQFFKKSDRTDVNASSENQKNTQTQNKQPARQERPQGVKQDQTDQSNKSLSRIFTYPADGKNFVLNTKESYNLLVNNNFWIKLQQPNRVIIQKKDGTNDGFLRQSLFSSSKDFLLEAEGITLTFNGNSNLEDGGVPIGNPIVKDFTGSDGQWFLIKTLDVFGYS